MPTPWRSFMIWTLVVLLVTRSKAKTQDIPSIYGPIQQLGSESTVDAGKYFKRKPSDFVHPGIWHSHDDLERIRNGVLKNKEPWASAYKEFSADFYSQANYTIQGPVAYLSRGAVNNYTTFTNDVRAAWQNALMWYITKDRAHWQLTSDILNGWGSTLTDIVGIDRSLLIGLEGDLFVNAAEIMRWEGNWTESGASWTGGSGFSNQLYWLFSRQSAVIGQANYGMVSIKSLLSFAVYLDDVDLYNYAINAYINGRCAGVFSLYEPSTGQSSESGRDQSHATSGIGWTVLAAKTAQTQGSDLFSLGNNLLLKGAEYTAKYNLNYTVDYDPDWYRCEAVLVNGPWANISEEDRGVTNQRPIWDMIYYEYVVKRGIHAPYTTEAVTKEGFEGRVYKNVDDLPSWGSLVFAY
ncbi:chondroitin AC/alginate lyase [Talaromyces proteolyticus]|uniref:Chondroitin AC/alginate lyase n=1 Tax=Talaromyces proteolyticus TaxID=1131652 RepID=A0AAD4KXX4_9EURO|nr:chondroitin AC/alginate lyase [Talaromyces proteolyticus]KAH8703600.1 chondroitin AC/alginate lyase [Talaromyces proteolyticus]